MFVSVVEGRSVPPGTARAVRNKSSFGSPTILRVHLELRGSAFVNANSFGAHSLKPKLAQSAVINSNSFSLDNFFGKLGPSAVINVNMFGLPSIFSKGKLTPVVGLTESQTFGTDKLTAILRASFVDNSAVNAFGTDGIHIPNQLVATVVLNASSIGGTVKLAAKLAQTAVIDADTFGADHIGPGLRLYQSSVINVSGCGGDLLRAKLSATGFANTNTFGSHSIGAPKAGLLETAFTAPPVLSGWIHRYNAAGFGNDNASSDISINGTPGVRQAHIGETGTTKNVRGLTKSVAGLTPPWTVTARLRRHTPPVTGSGISGGSAHAAGILLYEVATGKNQIFGWTAKGIGEFHQSALSTTYASGSVIACNNFVGGSSGDYDDTDAWFRVTRNASGKYDFAISQDGDFWSTIKAGYAPTNAFTVEANEIGIGLCADYNVGAQPITLDCFSWQITGASANVVQALEFSSTNAAFTLGTVPTPGNWLIAFWCGGNGSVASGWNLAHHVPGGISSPDMDIMYRQVQSGDGTSFTPSSSGGSGIGVVFEVANLPSTWAAIEQHEYDSTTTGGSTNNITGHACTANNTLVLAFARNNGLSGADSFTNVGWTQDCIAGSGHGGLGGHKLLASSGDSPPTLQVSTTGSFNISTLAELYLNSP